MWKFIVTKIVAKKKGLKIFLITEHSLVFVIMRRAISINNNYLKVQKVPTVQYISNLFLSF